MSECERCDDKKEYCVCNAPINFNKTERTLNEAIQSALEKENELHYKMTNEQYDNILLAGEIKRLEHRLILQTSNKLKLVQYLEDIQTKVSWLLMDLK